VSAISLVLYVEGRAESRGVANSIATAPTHAIPDESLGTAHVLVRRSIAQRMARPEASIGFVAPQRHSRTTRELSGSDLKNPSLLRRALAWPSSQRAPDLAVVLVDADGDRGIGAQLSSATQGLRLKRVIAVAVQEFEAWLIADEQCCGQIAGTTFDRTSDPEAMPREGAKRTLDTWRSRARQPLEPIEFRIACARCCSIDEIARRCPSFDRFLKDARDALTT
jgi:hypothetical protein